MTWPLRAVLIAAALAAVFAARVFVSFDGLRVKLIRDPVPVTLGAIDIPSHHDARTVTLRGPVALIAVVANPDRSAHQFSIAIDGKSVCVFRVGAESTERVDCAVSEAWRPGASPVIGISGDTAVWTLDFLEAASDHGSSSPARSSTARTPRCRSRWSSARRTRDGRPCATPRPRAPTS